MKRKIRTTVDWVFSSPKRGTPPLATNQIMGGSRIYIGWVGAILQDSIGYMQVSFLVEQNFAWSREMEKELVTLVQKVRDGSGFDQAYFDRLASGPMRMDYLFRFRRVPGESFCKTAMRRFTELIEVVEVPKPWRTIIAPKILQETYIERGSHTVPYAVTLAEETYWEGVK